jgi:hypothetical protein
MHRRSHAITPGAVVLMLSVLAACDPRPATQRETTGFEAAYRAAQDRVKAAATGVVTFPPTGSTEILVDQTGEHRWTLRRDDVTVHLHKDQATVEGRCLLDDKPAGFTVRLVAKEGQWVTPPGAPADQNVVITFP